MTNPLSNFDKQIKNSFEDFEMPYNADHWKEMQRELNRTAPSTSTFMGAATSALAAVSVIFIMLFLVADSSNYDYTVLSENTIESVENNEGGMIDTNKATKSLDSVTTKESEIIESENTDDAETKNDKTQTTSKVKTNKSTSPKHATLAKVENSPVKNIKEKTNTGENPHVRTGCTGLVIQFTASEEYGPDAKYLWNFGDGFFSNERNPSHTFNKEGVFDVSLSVTSKKTGHISSNIVQAMIEVIEAPSANLSIHPEGPTEIKIKNDSYNAEELTWTIDEKPISDKNEVLLNVSDNTQKNISLNVKNESGCNDSLKILLNCIQAGTEFPKVHSRSFGSAFAPGAILNKGVVTSINIYQKDSKNLVFSGTGNKGWNGTNLDGNPSDFGMYEWIMVVEKSGMVDVYKVQVELN